MITNRGFSLTEVLIALFLISNASLGLFIQQNRMIYLSSLVESGPELYIIKANHTEQLFAGFKRNSSG